jgi:hypothetical protein
MSSFDSGTSCAMVMVMCFLHMKRSRPFAAGYQTSLAHGISYNWHRYLIGLAQGISQDWRRVSCRFGTGYLIGLAQRCHRISAGCCRFVPLSRYVRSISQSLGISRLLSFVHLLRSAVDRLPLHHNLLKPITFRRWTHMDRLDLPGTLKIKAWHGVIRV